MIQKKENNTGRADTVSFIRYPIFKENQQLWGYRVRCIDRRGDAAHRISGEGDVSALVSTSSYMGLGRLLSKGKCLMVDFNQQSILKTIPHALPQSNSAIRVSERMPLDKGVLDALGALKEEGYRIAVSRFSGDRTLARLYDMADILCLKTGGKNRISLSEMVETASQYPADIMGEQVRERDHYIRCKELGFSLFQGAFFKTPEKISVRKISSNQASRFKLMKIIEADKPDFDALAEAIQSDVTISLRLLTYLNSAAFGLVRKISSIQQAITMLGWDNIKKWLRVVVLSDVSSYNYAGELVLISSQRGKFLEKIVMDHDFWGFNPDSLFLLGIFSLLDALLGIPMEKVVQHLPLEERLRTALLREANCEYGPFLELAEMMEDGEWDRAERMIQQLSMDKDKVKIAFHEAVEWANELSCIPS